VSKRAAKVVYVFLCSDDTTVYWLVEEVGEISSVFGCAVHLRELGRQVGAHWRGSSYLNLFGLVASSLDK
jgi:hypothetical protein